MTAFSRHGEWLSLIDVSGPFLAEPVLKQAFPQGLEQTDPLTRKHVRQAYDEWREAVDTDDPDCPAIHRAWIDLVLKRVLELDEDGEEDVLKPGSMRCPSHLRSPFRGTTSRCARITPSSTRITATARSCSPRSIPLTWTLAHRSKAKGGRRLRPNAW